MDARSPRGVQIYGMLREMILQGRVEAGVRLPPSRALARRLGVSRNTVLFAYEELAADGLVAGRIGAGTRVDSGSAAVRLLDPDGQAVYCVGLR